MDWVVHVCANGLDGAQRPNLATLREPCHLPLVPSDKHHQKKMLLFTNTKNCTDIGHKMMAVPTIVHSDYVAPLAPLNYTHIQYNSCVFPVS